MANNPALPPPQPPRKEKEGPVPIDFPMCCLSASPGSYAAMEAGSKWPWSCSPSSGLGWAAASLTILLAVITSPSESPGYFCSRVDVSIFRRWGVEGSHSPCLWGGLNPPPPTFCNFLPVLLAALPGVWKCSRQAHAGLSPFKDTFSLENWAHESAPCPVLGRWFFWVPRHMKWRRKQEGGDGSSSTVHFFF